MEAIQLLDEINIKILEPCLVSLPVNAMVCFLASQAVAVIITFNMRGEHCPVVVGL